MSDISAIARKFAEKREVATNGKAKGFKHTPTVLTPSSNSANPLRPSQALVRPRKFETPHGLEPSSGIVDVISEFSQPDNQEKGNSKSFEHALNPRLGFVSMRDPTASRLTSSNIRGNNTLSIAYEAVHNRFEETKSDDKSKRMNLDVKGPVFPVVKHPIFINVRHNEKKYPFGVSMPEKYAFDYKDILKKCAYRPIPTNYIHTDKELEDSKTIIKQFSRDASISSKSGKGVGYSEFKNPSEKYVSLMN